MAYAFPSSTNVFIPNTTSVNQGVTADLVVNFSRNIKTFALNQYSKLIPVRKNQGYYKRMAVGQQAKAQWSDTRNFLWQPGQGRPSGNWNKMGFSNFPWLTLRYAYDTTLDQLEIDLADYQIQPIHVAMLAQQAMTNRTKQAISVLTNANNWASTHTTNCTALVGGKMSAGTATNPYIMQAIQKMAVQINTDTTGAVGLEDLSIVMNPNTAKSLAQTQEIRSYLSNQVNAILFLQGKAPTKAQMYNLPDTTLYGVKYFIEDAVQDTGASAVASDDTANLSYVLPDGVVIMLGRPGDLPGQEGATDFSTLTGFFLEEMTTETFNDPKNRLVELSVVENFTYALTAPLSGYYLTGCI